GSCPRRCRFVIVPRSVVTVRSRIGQGGNHQVADQPGSPARCSRRQLGPDELRRTSWLDSPKTEGQALSRHRSPGGDTRECAALDDALAERNSTARIKMAQHRVNPPSSAVRGRVVVAAVALGAFAAAAAGQTLKGGGQPTNDDVAPLADSKNASAAIGVGGSSAAAPEVLTVARTTAAPVEAQNIAATNQIVQARADAAAAAKAEAERPKFVRPSDGRVSSGFGARWGTTHYGLDFAAPMGTPIYAAADGVVIEAGSASGFGLWVRVRHDDGTITVYGHINRALVAEGDRVRAGEVIAEVGNRGRSTGPHLHLEVVRPDGTKIDPRRWLDDRGVVY
ncbi:MAG: M23 family metallopeptidase, partial [Actinomycetes bacterium]